jgi:predicted nucleic acid-binding protein
MLDTSALAQRGRVKVNERLRACLADGAAVCDMVVAESLIRARSVEDLAARHQFFETIEVLPVDAEVWGRVFDLANLLAVAAKAVATGDAVIAACAEANDLIVVHYDEDYETLGEVAGTSHEWVVPRGAL